MQNYRMYIIFLSRKIILLVQYFVVIFIRPVAKNSVDRMIGENDDKLSTSDNEYHK